MLKSKQGFTIIEVVIVLAIAGFIFAAVLLTFPQLSKARRNSQIRGDTARAFAELQIYATNNNGHFPNNSASLADFESRHLDDIDFQSPYEDQYNLFYGRSSMIEAGDMVFENNATCDGERIVSGQGVALLAALDNSRSYYCVDSID